MNCAIYLAPQTLTIEASLSTRRSTNRGHTQLPCPVLKAGSRSLLLHFRQRMSLSTSIASSRGGGPRKHTGSISNPKHHHHQHSSGSRKHQSTNSEEEIAQRPSSTAHVISLTGFLPSVQLFRHHPRHVVMNGR
ncbi:hypothetical protein ACOMHN_012940 [Nucella lapillus]